MQSPDTWDDKMVEQDKQVASWGPTDGWRPQNLSENWDRWGTVEIMIHFLLSWTNAQRCK